MLLEYHAHNGAGIAVERGQTGSHGRSALLQGVWLSMDIQAMGLRRVGSSTDPYVLDADGSFLLIMEGRLEQPRDTKRRWPMFALTVPDLD